MFQTGNAYMQATRTQSYLCYKTKIVSSVIYAVIKSKINGFELLMCVLFHFLLS